MQILPFGDTAHSTWKILTHTNLAQIILSVFYIYATVNRRNDFSFNLPSLLLEQFQDNVWRIQIS
jgi:hypothetical protein